MSNNHSIPLNQAVAMTQRFRTNKSLVIAEGYDKNILPICETFDRSIIDNLMSTPRCTAFRIYYGMSDDLLIHAILVAVDGSGADILPAINYPGGSTGNNPDIGEVGQLCPPVCPPASPLNTA